MRNQEKRINSKGFTLVEVAIVLIIGGLIVSFAAASLQRYIKTSQIRATEGKLDDISTALQQFVNINGKYPCPADRLAAIDTATFGTEIDGINCSTVGVTGVVPNNDSFDVNGTGGRVVKIGAVPVRALGLPDDYIGDSWGNRFTYAVTAVLAERANYDQTLGSISITDSNPLTPPFLSNAHYVMISHGENGAGAATLSGGGTLPCTALPAAENGNCDNADATFVNTTLFSTVAGNEFDDYVKYRIRTSDGEVPAGAIMAFNLAGGCPLGWAPYSDAQGRMIRGADGIDPLVDTFPLYNDATTVGAPGPARTGDGLAGTEQHVLTYPEQAIQAAAVTLDVAAVAALAPGVDTIMQATAVTADPHENLPPVINLWYCEKT